MTVNGAAGAPSRKLRAGDVVVWTPPPVAETEIAAEEIPLAVVHEDRWLVVIDKPAGPGRAPGARARGGDAGERAAGALPGPARHRRRAAARDRAPHRQGHVGAAGRRQGRRDDERRWGRRSRRTTSSASTRRWSSGKPPGPGGRIDTLYGRDPRDRKKFSSRVRTGKRAVTNWRVVERCAGAARIEARLETGRTHQVRVHLAALGCPLLGDATYGRPPREPARARRSREALGRQALHARTLAFVHPATGKRHGVRIARCRADLQAALAALRALSNDGRRP